TRARDQDLLVHRGSPCGTITGISVPSNYVERAFQMSTPDGNRRRADAVRNRRLALQAATALLAEPGTALTVEAIATKAGLGAGARVRACRREGPPGGAGVVRRPRPGRPAARGAAGEHPPRPAPAPLPRRAHPLPPPPPPHRRPTGRPHPPRHYRPTGRTG